MLLIACEAAVSSFIDFDAPQLSAFSGAHTHPSIHSPHTASITGGRHPEKKKNRALPLAYFLAIGSYTQGGSVHTHTYTQIRTRISIIVHVRGVDPDDTDRRPV